MTLNRDENTVKIVPISERYIEGYHRCLDSVARERKYIGFLQAPPIESSKKFVLSIIDSDMPQFVALKDDEVIGWCDIDPGKREGFTHCGVLGMGVHKDYRRHGIGTRLLEHTVKKAKVRDIERVELEVYASNSPAISLYEKWGFLHEGIKKRARKLDGVYDDILVMALFI
jgi:ribosomal protein S18 acetylase RimI-like enzyme